MKVLYVVTGIAPPAGWGTEFIQNLIFSLTKKNTAATIVTPIFIHTPKNFYTWKQEVEKKYSLKIIVVKFPRVISHSLLLQLYLSPIFITLKVFSLLRKEKFDIVHEFTSTPVILLRTLLLKLFFNTPSIITLSVYNKTFLGSLKWFKFVNIGKFYLIPAKKIIDNLLQIGLDPKKIIFSPPGVYIAKIPISKLNSRRILNLPSNKTLITYYGTVTQEKGIEDIIKLSKDLSSNPNLKISLFTVRRGNEESKYLNYLKNANNIILREGFTDIPLVLSASDILMFPQSTGHGTVIPPISIIEAVLAGKPVIAKNTPGVGDILPKDNIYEKNLSEKILKVIKSSDKFEVNKNTLKMYNLEYSVNLHLEIYNKVLNEN